MTKKIGIKRPVTPVPHSLSEAAKFLSSIGREQREIDKVKTTLNDKVEELEEKAMDGAKQHEEEISQLVEGLFAFAEGQRDILTDSGKRKTVEVSTGTFGWRMTPPSVSIRDAKSVLARLKELELKRFIRVSTSEVPDKEAMLKEQEVAETVKGISIGRHEEFIVKPIELEVEIASNVNKLKKAAKKATKTKQE